MIELNCDNRSSKIFHNATYLPQSNIHHPDLQLQTLVVSSDFAMRGRIDDLHCCPATFGVLVKVPFHLICPIVYF